MIPVDTSGYLKSKLPGVTEQAENIRRINVVLRHQTKIQNFFYIGQVECDIFFQNFTVIIAFAGSVIFRAIAGKIYKLWLGNICPPHFPAIAQTFPSYCWELSQLCFPCNCWYLSQVQLVKSRDLSQLFYYGGENLLN